MSITHPLSQFTVLLKVFELITGIGFISYSNPEYVLICLLMMAICPNNSS
jgi:hypothetical protein